ncbi:hypothetical protein [Aeromonas veronii]|uniref:hypothetical protein n=2 Tax=Aeromonas TaxID=642 RepID=UPI0022481416|nr:hypothetical protein [Aeromonas veronii]MCX0429236.1 hypothetical protein [Aeromonas veronii]MCX0447200.1 hypothetical protein [Aeromonas veronii]
MKERRTTMGVTLDRKQILQKAVLDIAKKSGTVVKWTDVVNYMIDEYTQEAAKDLIDKIKQDPQI